MRSVYLAMLLAAAIAAPATADDWFTIEVIVFEHRDDASSSREHFPMETGYPDLLAAAQLVPPTVPRTLRDFEQLPRSEAQLAPLWRTLQRSGRYRPLLIAGWTQVARGPERALPVALDFRAGEPLAPEPLMPEPLDIVQPDGLNPPPEGADEAQSDWSSDFEEEHRTDLALADRLAADYSAPRTPQRLQGWVKLHLQRFLHVETDLLLTTDEPLPPDEDTHDWYDRRDAILEDVRFGLLGEAEAIRHLDALRQAPRFQAYRLQESRRIRSGEIHYLDHPKFGLIVTVRRLPRDEREQREQNMAEAARHEDTQDVPGRPSEPRQDLLEDR